MKFKVGDRIVATRSHGRMATVGDKGTAVEIDAEDPILAVRIQFDKDAPGFWRDGLWWMSADSIEHDPTAQPSGAIDSLKAEYSQAGEVVAMPGADGYTMCVFKAEDVPAGEVVYVCSEKGKGSPWYPPKDPEFGPWIEYNGEEKSPLNGSVECEVLLSKEREGKDFHRGCLPAREWAWSTAIVAYRVKK